MGKIDWKLIGIILSFAVVLAFLIMLAIYSPPKVLSGVLQSGTGLLKDDHEFNVYYQRVGYVLQGTFPYQAYRIEYPPLGVLYLTLPVLFFKSFLAYRNGMMVLNGAAMLALVYVTYLSCRYMGQKVRYVWLLALPSCLYFVLNRFDVFPALLVQLAFVLLIKKKFNWSFLILGLAFLAKGYSVVLFPVFFLYYLNQRNVGEVNLLKNKPVYFWAIPTALVTACICICAGWDHGMFPYIFQTTRDFAYGSVYVVYLKQLLFIVPEWIWAVIMKAGSIALTMLQITVPVVLFAGYMVFRKMIKRRSDVVAWSLFVLLLYVFFSKFYSNQWIVWLMPLLILFIKTKMQLIALVAFDIVNFLNFPVIWDALSPYSTAFDIIVVVRSILLAVVISFVVKRIYDNNRAYGITMKNMYAPDQL